jgi:hypothetical protein
MFSLKLFSVFFASAAHPKSNGNGKKERGKYNPNSGFKS